MSKMLNLYRLQQTDSQIDRVRARLQAVQDLLENDQAIRQQAEDHRRAKERLHTCQADVRQAEAAVQEQRIKVEQTEAALYAGKIHNPKELQDLQNDVAALKRRLTALEERQLEAMLALEQAEQDFAAAEQTWQTAQAEWSQKTGSLRDEQTTLQKEFEKLTTERAGIVQTLSQEYLLLYEQLRSERRGVAIAGIADNACEACGAQLTPAQAQAVRLAAQIIRCPSCGRILYGN
ncbi:MAG: C4-type zinc ribbon domain-containing protein [Anaerolineales bacterium]